MCLILRFPIVYLSPILLLVMSQLAFVAAQPSALLPPDLLPTTKAKPECALSGDNGRLHLLTFSPNGRLIAAGSINGTVIIWNVATREKIHVINSGNANGVLGWITGISFSPCSKTLATTANWDENVRLWDPSSGRIIYSYEVPYNSLRRVNFSPTGNFLAAVSSVKTSIGPGKYTCNVHVWDVKKRKRFVTFRLTKDLYSLAFSHNGRLIVGGCRDGTIIVWDVFKKQKLGTVKGHGGRIPVVSDVTFSPNGRYIASGGAHRVAKVWRVYQGRAGSQTKSNSKLFSMSCKLVLKTGRDVVKCIRWSSDGKLIGTASDAIGNRTDNFSEVAFWDSVSGKKIATLGSGKNGHCGTAVSFCPNGNQVATTNPGGVVKIWRLSKILSKSDSRSSKRSKISN